MSPHSTLGFGAPLIGRTEKSLDAILGRELEGSGVSRSGWVVLALAGGMGGRGRPELVEQAAAALKVDGWTAAAEIETLLKADLLTEGDAACPGAIVLTARGRKLQDRVRSRVGEITSRLWGDLPESDLATAGRVLGMVLSRANAELGYSI